MDTGSATIKSGFSEDTVPRSVFPTVIGFSSSQTGLVSNVDDYNLEYYIGEKALSHKRVKQLIFPIENGRIMKWDSIERIWHYIFYNELRVNPNYHPTLLTEPIFQSLETRKKIAEIMFETFCVPALYMSPSPLLALYATGNVTGVVVESGASGTYIVPFFEGFTLKHSIKISKVGGKAITDYLHKLLGYKHSSMKSKSAREKVKEIKESMCYVSLNPTKEKRVFETTTKYNRRYTLSDGEILEISSERIMAPELMFEPSLNGFPDDPLPDLIYQSIQSCEIDIRKKLYSNIILSGGNSMFYGFATRIQKELIERLPTSIDLHIKTVPDRAYLSWIGGSIFSSINTFPNLWLSRKKYKESGLDTATF